MLALAAAAMALGKMLAPKAGTQMSLETVSPRGYALVQPGDEDGSTAPPAAALAGPEDPPTPPAHSRLDLPSAGLPRAAATAIMGLGGLPPPPPRQTPPVTQTGPMDAVAPDMATPASRRTPSGPLLAPPPGPVSRVAAPTAGQQDDDDDDEEIDVLIPRGSTR
jgi:hypothetical protein